MERRCYASAFGSEPQWAEAAEMVDAAMEKAEALEKDDVAEMAEKDTRWRRRLT
jgi:hypothetical protein